MTLTRLANTIALKLSDVVISEIHDPLNEDPLKIKYSRRIIPLAQRFIDTLVFNKRKSISDRKWDIGFVGRFEREKSIDIVIKAFIILHRSNADLKLVMIGGGSYHDFARKTLEPLGITVLSYIPHDRLHLYYNDIKILLSPSMKEGVPTVLAEAMACGTIPVVSKAGGTGLLVKEGITGFFIDEYDAYKIIRKIKKVISMHNLEEISDNAAQHVSKLFSLSEAIKRYNYIVRAVTLK